MIRPSDRMPDELRKVELEINVNKHAEGSCSIKYARYLYGHH